MASQWHNFQRNLGHWQGTFTTLDEWGRALESTASLLSLTSEEEGRMVLFRLRRFPVGGEAAAPSSDTTQEYRTLGRQVVFFANGSFSKGSLQIAPATRFGAEYGFISGDRRHRLVQLFADNGRFLSLVLIREFRAGSAAREGPALCPDQLCGHWQGEAATIEADWPEPSVAGASVVVEQPAADALRIATDLDGQRSVAHGQLQAVAGAAGPAAGAAVPCYHLDAASGEDAPAGRLLLLPDGGLSLAPLAISHRQAFSVEAGWLEAPDGWQRLIRRYGPSGAWLSSTHIRLRRP